MAVRHNQGAVILVTLCQGRDRGYKGREGGGGGGGVLGEWFLCVLRQTRVEHRDHQILHVGQS